VSAARLAPLPDHLAQSAGSALSEEKLASSLRQLYATGLYDSVEAAGTRTADGVALIFRGKPAWFIGRVTVDGAKGATLNTQMEYASRLTAGTRFTEARLTEGMAQMRAILAIMVS